MPDNLPITQDGFQMLLGWLGNDDQSAAEKYEKVRQRLIRIFVGRGCYEAETLADRTIDRVMTKVPQISPGYVGDPAVYFYAVANKIHLEWLRSLKRTQDAPFVEAVAAEEDEEDPGYSCLELCLDELPSDSREMILEYYRDEKRAKIMRRKGLAEKLGISIGALQIKASRIRSRLSLCVGKCLEGGR